MRNPRWEDGTWYWLQPGVDLDRTVSGETTVRQVLTRELDDRRQVIPRHFRDATTDRTLEDDGLYLFGPVGTGKTHAAAGLANQAINHGLRVGWITVPAWLEAKRAAMNGAPPPITTQELAELDVVVLDDLGAEKASAWSQEVLFALVDGLYTEDVVQLIVTSNNRLGDLSQHLGGRIASRIAEMCTPLEVAGVDRRLQAAREQRANLPSGRKTEGKAR